MSKKTFKSQASSSRAAFGAFVSPGGEGFGGQAGHAPFAFQAVSSSSLSYVYEPPDLSNITDPNVVISLKNAQKKDATTKAKALEELQTYVQSLANGNIILGDTTLEAWITIYPRTSIDSSRRVRQLAHVLQGRISLLCGKGIAKHLPKIIGAWLAGMSDNDKLVANAAIEAFKQTFPNDEKQRNAWKVFRTSILEYCKNALFYESVASLSDERTTSPDDAEAKYARVLGTALLVIIGTLENRSANDAHKQNQVYQKMLDQEHLWKLATYQDPFVRRSLYRLIGAVLQNDVVDLPDLKVVSKYVINDALRSDQRGSAYEYSKMLAKLSAKCPEVWKIHSLSSKKSLDRNLCHFLGKGSQGAPVDFWKHVIAVIRHVPSEILSPQSSDAILHDEQEINAQILEAIHEGILRKEEPRLSQVEAWITYLQTATILIQLTSSPAIRLQLLESRVVPIIEQHLRPEEKQRRWTVLGSSPSEVITRALGLILAESSDVFHKVWNRLSDLLIQDMQISLPEHSQDYTKSQDDIGTKATRWYSLQASTLKVKSISSLLVTFVTTTAKEIQAAIDVLVTRNGKPYSAANSIGIAVRSVPQITLQENDVRKLITAFLRKYLTSLALSSSFPYLVSLMDEMGVANRELQEACMDATYTITNSAHSYVRTRSLKALLASSRLREGLTSSALGQVIEEELGKSLKGHDGRWDLVAVAMENSVMPAALMKQLLSTMTTSLSTDGQMAAGLRGLDLATKRNEAAVRDFSNSSVGSILLSRLLFLSDSPSDEISSSARTLHKSIGDSLEGITGTEIRTTPMVQAIRVALYQSGPESVSIETLVEQTVKVVQQNSTDKLSVLAQQLLPNIDQWHAALEPFFTSKPNNSLVITNPLGGALYFIKPPHRSPDTDIAVTCDLDGYSLPVRIIFYMVKIMRIESMLESMGEDLRNAALEKLAVFAELVTDGLSVSTESKLWKADAEVENEMSGLLADTQNLVSTDIQSRPHLIRQLWRRSVGRSVASYYNARAYATLVGQILERDPSAIDVEKQQALQLNLKDENVSFNTIALLASAVDPKNGLKLCNGFVDTIAAVDFESQPLEALQPLTLFNCLISSQEDLVEGIPQRRLVFHVKHLSIVLQNAVKTRSMILSLESEVCKNLAHILKHVSDVYGEFWEIAVTFIAHHWSNLNSIADEDIVAVYASLQLYSALERIRSGESNDDFSDIWLEKSPAMTSSMITLLKSLSEHPDELHQPRRIANELLLRLISKKVPSEFTEMSPEELYPVMASDSCSLQEAAYGILQGKVLTKQEQISLEAALSDSFVAKLPEALLSLILAPPLLDSTDSSIFRREIPLPVRTYLLSWVLVFDHWKSASYKVQNQYADCIKDGLYIKGLLNFVFENLITRRPRPVDASRFTIGHFELHGEDSADREFQWLLCHLYYRCLLHLPLLSKVWWRDDTSRQLQRPAEEWTGKFITPVVISTTLDSLASLTSTVEEPLEIKAQYRAKEVVATYPIDDQFLSIKLSLPPTYPLAPITVLTSNRVGIEEKKWHSWLLTISGIINFPATSSSSNNSSASGGGGGGGGAGAMMDGILVWRKNIEGALKGQSECSICYSVVGADRQLPNKRCGTCRNFFHGGCLFRWFRSSNSSSCPLCRNAFNYG